MVSTWKILIEVPHTPGSLCSAITSCFSAAGYGLINTVNAIGIIPGHGCGVNRSLNKGIVATDDTRVGLSVF